MVVQAEHMDMWSNSTLSLRVYLKSETFFKTRCAPTRWLALCRARTQTMRSYPNFLYNLLLEISNISRTFELIVLKRRHSNTYTGAHNSSSKKYFWARNKSWIKIEYHSHDSDENRSDCVIECQLRRSNNEHIPIGCYYSRPGRVGPATEYSLVVWEQIFDDSWPFIYFDCANETKTNIDGFLWLSVWMCVSSEDKRSLSLHFWN